MGAWEYWSVDILRGRLDESIGSKDRGEIDAGDFCWRRRAKWDFAAKREVRGG